MKISLLALGATSIAQLVIVAVSGSVALLADTIHNFAMPDRHPAVDRVRTGHQDGNPPLHIRVRAG